MSSENGRLIAYIRFCKVLGPFPCVSLGPPRVRWKNIWQPVKGKLVKNRFQIVTAKLKVIELISAFPACAWEIGPLKDDHCAGPYLPAKMKPSRSPYECFELAKRALIDCFPLKNIWNHRLIYRLKIKKPCKINNNNSHNIWVAYVLQSHLLMWFHIQKNKFLSNYLEKKKGYIFYN